VVADADARGVKLERLEDDPSNPDALVRYLKALTYLLPSQGSFQEYVRGLR
jgi:hypothetical protein